MAERPSARGRPRYIRIGSTMGSLRQLGVLNPDPGGGGIMGYYRYVGMETEEGAGRPAVP